MALCGLGNFSLAMGRLEAARTYFEKALAIVRRIGDRLREAPTLGSLGMISMVANRRDEACRLLKEAHSLFAQLGVVGENPDKVSAALRELGCE